MFYHCCDAAVVSVMHVSVVCCYGDVCGDVSAACAVTSVLHVQE